MNKQMKRECSNVTAKLCSMYLDVARIMNAERRTVDGFRNMAGVPMSDSLENERTARIEDGLARIAALEAALRDIQQAQKRLFEASCEGEAAEG